jgi:hypothetical protein
MALFIENTLKKARGEMKLKAYIVYPDGYRSENSELVFHHTGRRAKALAWKKPYGEFGCDFTDLRVLRIPDADVLCSGESPYVCKDDAIFRAAGWRGEDCNSCDSCGLTDFSDGENPDWAVCAECWQCGECGCECDENILESER